MTSVHRSTTPPPSSRTRVPQTPRWGDDFAPYSPRKSARLSQLSHGSSTPQYRSYRDTINSVSSSDNSPNTEAGPSSPQTAKKRNSRQSSSQMGGRRVSGALTRESTTTAASALGLPPPKMGIMAKQSASVTRTNGLLPTPDKTPKKRPETITPAVKSVARNLFAIRPAEDEVMPTPRRGRNKHAGFTLDSFEDAESLTPIQIYTDSNDRVPELDTSPENPFYGERKTVTAEPTKRSSKRRKVCVEGEDEQEIEDLAEREDGLIYVFRGKKTFRKFAEPEAESEEDEPESTSPPKRMTRSSIKPRLLFPGPKQTVAKEHTTEDEEADTDIEEEEEEVFTPAVEEHDMGADTPHAPKFAAAMYTPPTTVRTTRTKKIDLNGAADGDDDEMDDAAPTSPMLRAATRMTRSNPFEEWSRTPSIKDSKKRAGEASSSGASKRARF